MINEPVILCECDECEATEEVSPEYKCRDYPGNNGHYDCDDDAVIEKLNTLGWLYDEGTLFCDECAAQKRIT